MDKTKKASNLSFMNDMLIIDLGTNTAIFSVIKEENASLIITYEKSITTRIGENISNKDHITDSVLERNIKMISEELGHIRQRFNIKNSYAMATEAIRCAVNGNDCLQALSKACNVNFEAISGEHEARLTELALMTTQTMSKDMVICDIGGGSTELTIIKNNKTELHKSLPLGVVRLESELKLTGNRIAHIQAVKKINELLSPLKSTTETLLLCGGTATTTASILLKLDNYDPKKVEGFELKKEDTDDLLNELYRMDVEKIKKLLRTDTGRSDLITAGAVIIRTLFNVFSPKKVIISTLGPRHGYIMERLGVKSPINIVYRLLK